MNCSIYYFQLLIVYHILTNKLLYYVLLWIFVLSCFQGVSVLLIDKTTEVVTNIIDRHKIILKCLGKPYWEFYS